MTDQDLAWLPKLVAEAHSGHGDGYHDEHGYEFHDEGSPYCPECDTAKAALTELEALADPLVRCALALRLLLERIDEGHLVAPREYAIAARQSEGEARQALATLAEAREARRG